ncbi:sortase [Candidatus Parcubacteria bacterium]|nr:sortase [Candidatus Parcubacteria bacterium]
MNIFSKQEIKKLWKPFVVLFVFSFLAMNWADVSWVFNYRIIAGIATAPFQSMSAVDAEENGLSDLERASVVKEDKTSENKKQPKYTGNIGSKNSIKIPKIGISAPIVFTNSSNNQVLHKLLDKGVVYYPESVLFGENGQTIVLGHSAPANWPKIKYDWVFSRLNELNKGDKIIIYYDNQKYVYSVSRKIFLDKGEEIPENHLTNNRNILISISCWPPGKDYKRIAVESVLID